MFPGVELTTLTLDSDPTWTKTNPASSLAGTRNVAAADAWIAEGRPRLRRRRGGPLPPAPAPPSPSPPLPPPPPPLAATYPRAQPGRELHGPGRLQDELLPPPGQPFYDLVGEHVLGRHHRAQRPAAPGLARPDPPAKALYELTPTGAMPRTRRTYRGGAYARGP